MLRRRPKRKQARSRPVWQTLPDVNTRVSVQAADWPTKASSRIEDVNDEGLVLSAPQSVAGEPVQIELATDLLLTWTTPRGVYNMLATLVSIDRERLPTWTAMPLAEPDFTQRRKAFRLETRSHVRLEIGGETVLATMLDLSEGGLRCRLSEIPDLELGTRIPTRLELEDGPLDLASQLVRLEPPEDGKQAIGLQFCDVTPRITDRLHRHVFQEQLRRRADLSK